MATNGAGLPPREAMEFDCVIVGAGPAGLAAAIRLKQRAAETGKDVSVVVLEKGSEVGAHILSGAVIDPIGLDRLIPDWKAKGAPIDTAVTKDKLLVLGPAGEMTIPNWPLPPLMRNHGNYIVSLGAVCKWLGEQAAELGVEIYPGFAASEILYDDKNRVAGVATGDMGVGRDGKPKETFVRGMELRGKYTLLGEGARGSLSKQLIKKYALERRLRAAEVRHWHQGTLAGCAREARAWARPAHVRLAVHQGRFISLSLRREPGFRRIRRASQLRKSVPVTL